MNRLFGLLDGAAAFLAVVVIIAITGAILTSPIWMPCLTLYLLFKK